MGLLRPGLRAWVLLLAVLCGALPAAAQTLQAVPPLEAHVTDLTGTLTADQQADLEQRLAAFEQRKGAQIALLVVASTQPETIEQYSIRVAEAWKLGRKEPDDGALLLVAMQDRQLRIEVGYGLEGALPDAIASRIIRETITPLFRQGDFHGGISAGLTRIMNVVDGEPLPPPDQKWQGAPGENLGALLPLLFFGVLVVGAVLRAVFGRTAGALLTGGLTGGVVWLLSKVLLLAGFAGVAALLLSLVAGVATNVRNGRGGRSGPWGGWGGGLGGGGFGGGSWGGGGGFGGGGGSFGGGGASGRW
ncbi:MAG: YgcG family protein [Steroidobacteraceae bacterium]